GEACFICEGEGGDVCNDLNSSAYVCPQCPTLPLTVGDRGKLLQHIGGHILFDALVLPETMPCGFCLSVGSFCAIYLVKGRGSQGGHTVDMQRTRCPNKFKISITRASKSTKTAPCTNVPPLCPLCPKDSPAVWKYNLQQHLMAAHKTDPERFKMQWDIADEERAAMKTKYNARSRSTKCKHKQITKSSSNLPVSDGH
ncbi:hypothetical protein BKA93DRAFT_694851, partial [Sparassis latifolia]